MGYYSSDELTKRVAASVRAIDGSGVNQIVPMPGGASLRRYHRVRLEGGERASLVVMELGDQPLQSEEATGGGVHPELPFINVQRYLLAAGVAVPQIYRHEPENGLLYLEDLGDITFESKVVDADADVQRQYYELAIDQLIQLQRYARQRPDPSCIAFARGFDFKLLKWELDHFVEFGLEAQGIELNAGTKRALDTQFSQMAARLSEAPRLFVHRDYQSRNLMVQGEPACRRLRVIDFQDALLGTAAYDLVGLLRDSYVELPPVLLDNLISYYVRTSGADPSAFGELFDLQTVQRKLKDAGRFVFIDQVKHNPNFLAHIPTSLGYVARALKRQTSLAPLQEILSSCIPRFFSI